MAILITGLISPVFSQKKTIDIDFEVNEVRYREFYGSSINDLEAEGAKQIALRLQQDVPFITFSDQIGDHKITFTLDKENTGIVSEDVHRVDMFMGVNRSDALQVDPISHEFRSLDRYIEPLPSTVEAFLQEIDAVLDFWLDQEKETIVREVFSQISLGERAHPDLQTKSWVMPFSQKSLSIGTNSEFLVRSKIQTSDILQNFQYEAKASGKVLESSTLYPVEYRGNILATLKGTDHIDVMDNVQVEGIYILKFIRAVLPETISPEEFDL
ncbi:MAG: hypothetical protein ACR2MX_04505 [Cyclobacteriaceae bacterium]